MANESLQSLADALARDSAKGPVTLNAVYIEACGIAPPANFDASLKAAWRLAAADTGLQLTFQPSDVGPITGNSFRVTNAKLTKGFLNATAAQTSATLTFTLPENPLQVQIEAKLSNWKFLDFFTWWKGRLFDQLVFTTPAFIFTTLDTAYTWSGRSIALKRGQNFSAMANLPASLQPILNLLSGLGVLNPPFVMSGPIVVDKADNENILYPDCDLNAVLSTGAVELFYLKAHTPSIGLRIETEDGQFDNGLPEEAGVVGETTPIQTPILYMGIKIDVPTESRGPIKVNFEARGDFAGTRYGFSIIIDPDSPAQLTPDTVIALMAGDSYFQYVPPPLQQFLTNVGLKGFTLSGPVSPPGITSIGANLGSVGDFELVLFKDPTNNTTFAIKSFDLEWTIISPLEAAMRQSLVSFNTTFILWPTVFRRLDGTEGGEFMISIDQDFNVDGGFYGSVSMDALLQQVTMGLIGMPSGVEATFSNVTFSLSPTAKSYAFGFTLDLDLNFIMWDGKPLVQFRGLRFDLAASTPTTSAGAQRTVYRATMAGVIGVGPIMVNAFVQYDGTRTPSVWTLQTSLAQPLSLSDLVNQFFQAITGDYDFPDFLPGSLVVESFALDATIPSKPKTPPPPPTKAPQPTYKVAGKVRWDYDGLPFLISTTAEIGLQYDGNKIAGQQFSGSLIGSLTLTFDALAGPVVFNLMAGYQFGPAALDPAGTSQTPASPNSSTMWLQWEGIRGTYDFNKNTVTFTLNGWTAGGLIEALVRLIGDPYFTLEAPWNVLNQISLNGLFVSFDLNANVTNRVKAGYTLPSPIDFGFMKITGLTFQLVNGAVTIAITGSSTVPGMANSPLFNPNGPGQNVQNMPPVPGQGNELFDLRLLAMGQRVGIVGADKFDSTQAVIRALEGVPPTTGKTNPVNPGSTQLGQPYYNAANNWMVGLDFGLLRVGNVYTFDCMVVFNDPSIYGLRLQFNGEKAKVLAGLVIDILYKKITDDIGLYQLDFSFPSILRNLDFGAFSIVLPEIRIQIYTNGDFFFDFGFPYNLNFARSFTVQAIVYGVPVLGSAGFYFGKLSNATATGLPQTTCGTFDPVIVFGFGAQLGIGRYFEKGPLKAGFSITVFGIIQGMFAAWNPYSAAGKPSGSAVQGNYYFKLEGSFGVIGKLYGTVDFAIIKADVELLVQIVAKITYESFKPIPLSLSAHVSVKVSLKINLGLFSISISFSFAMTISVDLTIGLPGNAPWNCTPTSQLEMRRMQAIAPQPRMALLRAARPRFKTIAAAANATLPTLTLTPAPQFTVGLEDIGSTDPMNQQGAFVFLLAMDAPTAGGTGNAEGSSFQSLCEGFLPWVIDAFTNHDAEVMQLQSVAEQRVTREELQAIVDALANSAEPSLAYEDLLKFLRDGFTINIAKAAAVPSGSTGNVAAGATIFPPFTGLSLTVPKPDGAEGTVTIAFDNYTTVTGAYRADMTKMFNKLAARVQGQGDNPPALLAVGETPEGLAQFLFEDYFTLIARQLVQAAADAMNDYLFKLDPATQTDSLASILAWARERGNDHLTAADIATPNITHALTTGKILSLPGLSYTIQQGNSLTAIAARYTDPATSGKRWATTPSAIILLNQSLSTAIATGAELTMTVKGVEVPYVTRPGDSFLTIAQNTDQTIDQLAAQTSIYGVTTLMAPSASVAIPPIAYTTAAGDTLEKITAAFAIALGAIIDLPANMEVANLFDANGEGTISIANLDTLYVSDLWDVIVRGDQVAQTAGMAARFPLYGVRLPNLDGLGLAPGFLYPAAQPSYGLYQLSGQQFPTPAAMTTYGITLARNTALDWIEFDGETGDKPMAIDLTKQATELTVLVEYARTTGYNPVPTVAIQPDVKVTAKRFAVRSYTLWSTSDQSALAAITAPAGTLNASLDAASGGAQPQPVLWEMPDTLLSEVEARQAALATRFEKVDEAVPYLPVYDPQIGTTDPATRQTTFAPADNYAFATRIDFIVKRLAQDDDLAPQNPFANDVVPPDHGNDGSQARPLAPYNYELIGPGPADAILLQRLLTAMDSMGQEIISGLFILYPDNPAAPNGLVSRGNAEFLSFITQTNLSTETNPPQLAKMLAATAGQQPRGIANSPGEFIKLMWELSTVRSGGYYLYYQLVDGEAGLPDDLFDDSGIATLTLVIAYDRASEPANGGVLMNYTNAFITTDPIDIGRSVMTIESASAQATTAKLAGTETLDTIAALYGASIGTLATLNPTTTIAGGRPIPIAGAIRQVTQADLAAGNVLEAYATYYSRGAVTAISATDIANYNPGVQVALTSVFRIPPVTYSVSGAAGGPGTSFGSIGAYYALSPDALADLARSVPNIFAKDTVLETDSRDFDVQPALGTGNIGVDITRVNLGTPPDLPANPTPEQKRAFAEAYIYSLYQLLSAGLAGNPFFNPSNQGLSFGPRSPLTAADAAAMRRPGARRMMLAAGEDPLFEYSQAIGYGNSEFARKNAAPDAGTPWLPQKSANPYIAVGTLAQVNMQWVDLFGNRALTPFNAPKPGYNGPLNNPPVAIDYVDELIGLERWPNVRAYYTYTGTPGSPRLQIVFALNTAAYQPSSGDTDPCKTPPDDDSPQWQKNAVNDLGIFTQLYFQLNQNYDTLGIPGLSGNAVWMTVRNSILAAPAIDLDPAREQDVRNFVAACTEYTNKRAQCTEGGDAPTLTLTLDVPLASLAAENIMEFAVAFGMSRAPELCDPALRVLPNATAVSTTIQPLMDDKAAATIPPPETDDNEPVPPPQDLKKFANAVEKVFVNDDWQIRVGTGAALPDQPRASATFSVWGVRMGKKPGMGLTYDIGSQASFYAPQPVETKLRGGTVPLHEYTTGQPYPSGQTVPVTFTGVDMNVWSNTALTEIDNFLSATFSAPAYIVDCLTFTDPENEGYVAQMLKHKGMLANAIASTVRPILATSATDQDTHAAAEEKLRQALLNRLSNAFIVTAVTVLPISNASTNEPQAPGTVAPPRFYGQPQGTEPAGNTLKALRAMGGDVTSEQNYSLSSGKLPLRPKGAGADTRLAFLFSSKNVKAQPYVALDLSYALTHLEFNIRNVPGIDNYEQSSWITFANGPFVTPISPIVGGSQIPTTLPVVLRALPTPPTVASQSALAAEGDPITAMAAPLGATPADLARWIYEFEYIYLGAAQDSATATMEFNLASAFRATAADPTETLFNALAQFMTVYPQIQQDLDLYLRPVSATSKPADVTNAREAVAALSTVTGDVATAYKTWADAQIGAANALRAGAPVQVTFIFDVALADDGGRGRIDIYQMSLVPEGTKLPKPVVLIQPDAYEAIEVAPPAGGLVSYVYKLRQDGSGAPGEDQYMSYAEALANPNRTAGLGPLNLFGYQNAWSAVQIVRNKFLVPGVPTTDWFRFRTPNVQFAQPIVPLLQYEAYDLGAVIVGNAPLADFLNDFFESLLSGAVGQRVEVKMGAAYSYRLLPSLPYTTLPVSLMPPTSVTPQPGVPPEFIAPFSAAVTGWLRSVAPEMNDSSLLVFDLAVFAGLSADAQNQQPLMMIRSLRLDANRVAIEP